MSNNIYGQNKWLSLSNDLQPQKNDTKFKKLTTKYKPATT
jgi:hypothetical protein